MNTEPLQGELHDNMEDAVRSQALQSATPGTALAQASNPFMPMAMLAMEKGAMDQLERLLDLQMKWDADQARKAWVAAMAAFKALPIKIIKAKLVKFETNGGGETSYRHATLADVVDAVVAGMGKHGLSHRWDVKQVDGQVSVTCTITHSAGHSEAVTMQAAPDNSGKKNNIQQVASAVTYLQRYTLMAATGVAASDMEEDDGIKGGMAQVETIDAEQAKVLRDLMDAYVTNPLAFFGWINKSFKLSSPVAKIEDLPADCYDAVHNQLGKMRQQKMEGSTSA